MRTPGLPLVCFRSMQFLKINILQGNVVTFVRGGDVCNNPFIADFMLSVTMKELKNGPTSLKYPPEYTAYFF